MRHSFFIIFLLLIAGGLGTWLILLRADREMRQDLIQQATLVAGAVNQDQVKALAGTTADLASPNYQRLKQQFVVARQVTSKCRFLYLMGRKPDGTVFFQVDSEPAESKDYSPPGQVFEEISEGLRRAFGTKIPVVEGPVSDHWGRWISALVPLTDPTTGRLIAVFGMDIDASDWNRTLARHALAPLQFTLALIAIQLLGSLLLAWRSRITGVPPRWMRRIEPAWAVAVGLVLTLCATWLTNEREIRFDDEEFTRLARSRTDAVAEALRQACDSELESLAQFCESEEKFSAADFRRFTAYLTKNSAGQAWEWVPLVPAAEKSRFEAEARATGLPDFEIWQKSEREMRMPATGREAYYPISRVAPMAGNEPTLGYDLGSESVCRQALNEAARTGLPTATPAILLRHEITTQKGLRIYRPVFSPGEPKRLRGFAVTVLRLGILLKRITPEDSTYLKLTLLRQDGEPEQLAATYGADWRPLTNYALTRPLFFAGNTLAVKASAGPAHAHRMSTGWLIFLAGLLLTAAMVKVITIILHGRENLEQAVRDQTAALRESEELPRLLLENIDAGVAIIDASTHVIEQMNKRGTELLGREERALIGQVCQGFICLTAAGSCPVGDLGQSVTNMERILIRSDRSLLPVLKSARRIYVRGREKILETFVDISEQKKTEEALRQATERLSLAVQAGGVGIWDYDVVNNQMVWDDQMFSLYGVVPDQFGGAYEAWQAGVHPEDRQRGDEEIQQALRGEKDFDTEFRVFRPDGMIRNIRARAIVRRNAFGQPVRMIGTNWDVTAQKKMENQLREHAAMEMLMASLSARFINLAPSETDRAIQNSLGEIGTLMQVDRAYVFAFTPDLSSFSNTHEWCSEGTSPQIANLQNESAAALPWWMAALRRLQSITIPEVARMPAEAAAEKESLDAQSVKSLLVVPMVWAGKLEGFVGFDAVKHTHQWNSEDEVPLELLASIIINALKRKQSEEHLQASQQALRELNATLERRVDERTRQLQETQTKLFLQDKMASVGQLAAGLAHEINNPVSFIATNFATLEEDVQIVRELLETYRELVAASESAVPALRERIAEVRHREKELALDFMLRDLPNLFEESRDGFRRVTAIINSVRNFAHRDTVGEFTPFNLNKGVEDTLVITRNSYKYNAEIKLELGDLPEIPCVSGQINQVLLNLIVNAAQALAGVPGRTGSRSVITIRTRNEANHVMCEVEDNGPGIPAGLERQIFDPFFTTKAPGNGTGLGLSISYNIVVGKHGGTLTVANVPSGGACFRMTLPHQPPATAPEERSVQNGT